MWLAKPRNPRFHARTTTNTWIIQNSIYPWKHTSPKSSKKHALAVNKTWIYPSFGCLSINANAAQPFITNQVTFIFIYCIPILQWRYSACRADEFIESRLLRELGFIVVRAWNRGFRGLASHIYLSKSCFPIELLKRDERWV